LRTLCIRICTRWTRLSGPLALNSTKICEDFWVKISSLFENHFFLLFLILLLILGDYLRDFIALCRHHETMKDLFGRSFASSSTDLPSAAGYSPNEGPSAGAALSRLTGPTYSFGDIIRSGRHESKEEKEGKIKPTYFLFYDHSNDNNSWFLITNTFLLAPIKKEHLRYIMDFLFPDSNPDSKFPYEENLCAASADGSGGRSSAGIKSAPENGLLWRLAVVMAHCLHLMGKVTLHLFFS